MMEDSPGAEHTENAGDAGDEEAGDYTGWAHYIVPGAEHAEDAGGPAIDSQARRVQKWEDRQQRRTRPPRLMLTSRSETEPVPGTRGPDGIWPADKWASGASLSMRRDGMRVWSVVVAGALAGVLVVMLGMLVLQMQQRSRDVGAQGTLASGGTAADNSSAMPPAAVTGRFAPDFTLTTPDGKSVKLSDLRGKPVWVNFWATWCPPCRAEMPEMKQKYAEFKSRGLVVLGVDMNEDPSLVKQFIQSNGYDWTFLLDSRGQIASRYYVSGIPTHLFVGRDGIVKAVQIGGIPASMMDQYLARIMDAK